ncbi:MAG: hypothetical protein ACTSRZ_19065 [Promethearchaeota archaeon]
MFTISTIKKFNENGIAYSKYKYINSDIIQSLKTHKFNGTLYSNNPWLIYIHVNLDVKQTPRKYYYNSETPTSDLPKFKEEISSSYESYIIWFNDYEKPYLYSINELKNNFTIIIIESKIDGYIFQIFSKE